MVKRVLLPFRNAHKLAPYVRAVEAGGMEPVPRDVAHAVEWGDEAGLILLGGTDVNPALYGDDARHQETEEPDEQRDETELRLIDEAIRRDMPILAICRGLQILNVYHGGKLVQHLNTAEQHDVDTANKGLPAHEVSIEPESLLRAIAGVSQWRVNSRHHQAAASPGEGLKVVASARDGTIEGLERSDRRFVLAVQWHPEDQIAEWPDQLKLFKRFGEAL